MLTEVTNQLRDIILKDSKKLIKITPSKISSDVRKTFFRMGKVRFETAAQKFSQFQSENYRTALEAEVVKYSNEMMQSLPNKDEIKVVHPALKRFWSAVIEAMAGNDSIEHIVTNTILDYETPYTYTEEIDEVTAMGEGSMDHAVFAIGTSFICLTIEDKYIGLELLLNTITGISVSVAQACSQVKYAVNEMIIHLRFVPREFVGLLQNGLQWVGIFRVVKDGQTSYTYTIATTIPEIVALLEHALCVANQVCKEILDENERPNQQRLYSPLHSIREESNQDEDPNEEGDDSNNNNNTLPDPPSKQAPSSDRKPSSNHQNSNSTEHKKRSSNEHQTKENDKYYFVLPLTEKNLTANRGLHAY
jgi:hypothetical protein